MTMPDVVETIPVQLGDQTFTITPILRFVFYMEQLDDLLDTPKDELTPEHASRMPVVLMDAMRCGMSRTHSAEEVDAIVMEFTFTEIVNALRIAMSRDEEEEDEDNLDFTNQSPTSS